VRVLLKWLWRRSHRECLKSSPLPSRSHAGGLQVAQQGGRGLAHDAEFGGERFRGQERRA
jgi:hypothetical protein